MSDNIIYLKKPITYYKLHVIWCYMKEQFYPLKRFSFGCEMQ